jgi:hypothetical protein
MNRPKTFKPVKAWAVRTINSRSRPFVAFTSKWAAADYLASGEGGEVIFPVLITPLPPKPGKRERLSELKKRIDSGLSELLVLPKPSRKPKGRKPK